MPFGSLYFGKTGFYHKRMGGASQRRAYPFDIMGGAPYAFYNKFVPGSGVASMGLSMSNRAALRRRAIVYASEGASGCACGAK